MKYKLFCFAAALVFFACQKTNSAHNTSGSLQGNWRMVSVTENSSGTVTTKAPSIQGDVDLSFTAVNMMNGFFQGNTPTNDISPSDYSTGANQSLSIPALSMTKVGETSWGKEFVDNIRDAQAYSFETDGKLSIKTKSKTLTFVKL
ncbi:MAG: hypothetical protein JST75_18640 [Bacteroidetes bacterium]|nr:hypothetical protein [Bacteroidota bacterium]